METENKPKLIIPAILGLAIIVTAFFLGRNTVVPAPVIEKTNDNVAGQYNSISPQVPSIKVDGLVNSNGITNFQKIITIASGSNYKVFTNTSATTLWITDASLITAGVASSSVKIYAFATSTNSLISSQFYTAPSVTYGRGLINGVLLATTTAATSTSTFTEAQNANPAKSDGLVGVPSGWSVIALVQNANASANAPNARCTDPNCAQATSTDLRLTPVTVVIKGFSTSTEDFNVFQY